MIYNCVRSVGTSPNLLVSEDGGDTWQYGGRLTSTPTVGYVSGYYKYWGNNEERIDFLATENHPRDFDNSLYHGYITNEASYYSNGMELDGDITDDDSPEVTDYTTLFPTGGQLNWETMGHLWNADIVRYDDGMIATIWTARANGDINQHRSAYSRFVDGEWQHTYLARMGQRINRRLASWPACAVRPSRRVSSSC